MSNMTLHFSCESSINVNIAVCDQAAKWRIYKINSLDHVVGKTAYDLVTDENVRMVFSEELLQATAQSK